MTVEQTYSKNSFGFSSLLSVVLLIVLIGGVYLFVLPSKDAYDKNAQALAQKQTQLETYKSDLSKVQSLETSFTGSEVTQKDILNLIPQGMRQDLIIDLLAKTADETQISLNSLSFGVSQGSQLEAGVVTVTMNVSGTHNDLLKFIGGLEVSSRKFLLKTISVQTLENRLENMSITMDAYYI